MKKHKSGEYSDKKIGGVNVIKGAQKQMIVVKTGESRYFDEAYFVLRREVKPHRGTRNEMLLEADRILAERTMETYPRKKRLPRGVLLFFAGILCGGIAAAVVCLLLF